MDKKGKKKAAAGDDAGGAGPASWGRGNVFASVMNMPDVPHGLPDEVELARTRVICGPDFNSNVRCASGRCEAAFHGRPKPSPAACALAPALRARAQTEDYSSANSFMVCGVDNAFSLDDFKGRFSIDVTSLGAFASATAAVSNSRLRCSPRAAPLPLCVCAQRAAHTTTRRARSAASALRH